MLVGRATNFVINLHGLAKKLATLVKRWLCSIECRMDIALLVNWKVDVTQIGSY